MSMQFVKLIFLKMKSNQNNQRTSMRCADLLYQPSLAGERVYQPSLADKRRHAYFSSSTAACAAAKRAIGTRNGEQEA